MKNVKKRLFSLVMAMLMTLGIMPSVSAAETMDGGDTSIQTNQADMPSTLAEDLNGGYALSLANQTVYSSASGGYSIGSIFKNEGITVLWTQGNVAKIEYSTSNGTKQGYLYNPNYRLMVGANSPAWDNTSVAWVSNTSSVYYGPNTSEYQKVGTVYAGEYVAALGASNGWAYIEYNTSSGRKRGYVWEDNLDIIYWLRLRGNLKDESSIYDSSSWVSGRVYVYAGPSTRYFTVGYVQDENIIRYNTLYEDADGRDFQYIEYYVSGTSMKKSGFIPW